MIDFFKKHALSLILVIGWFVCVFLFGYTQEKDLFFSLMAAFIVTTPPTLFGFIFGLSVMYERWRGRKRIEVTTLLCSDDDGDRDYFIGVEAEGPFKGDLTLFIASDEAPPEKIIEFLKEHEEIKNVYFGADGVCYMPKRYISLVNELILLDKKVIIEIDNMQSSIEELSELPVNNVFIVYKVEDDFILKDYQRENFMVKFDSGKWISVLYSLNNFGVAVTKRNDVRFTMDKKITLKGGEKEDGK